MSNALWTGIRLKDVLDRAGVKAGAMQVRFAGLDDPVIPEAPKFLKRCQYLIGTATAGETPRSMTGGLALAGRARRQAQPTTSPFRLPAYATIHTPALHLSGRSSGPVLISPRARAVTELEAMARVAGLLNAGQAISQCRPFRDAKRELGVTSDRKGFGRAGEYYWRLPVRRPLHG